MLDPNSFDLDANLYFAKASMAIPEDIQNFLVDSITAAIKHTRKFFLTRKNPPTIAEQIGEFVNGLRRQFHARNDKLYLEFVRMLDVDIWSDIAVPCHFRVYKWDFIVSTKSGDFKMSQAIASTICQTAKIMAQDKNLDEEFLEINNILNNLLKENNVLDTLVHCAKDLNTKAGVVVDNLCSIAEKLQENQ